MSTPVALQLYTVRDHLREVGLVPTLERVARMGYVGVEPFGLDPASAKLARDACDELGLLLPSLHAPLAAGEKRQEVVDTALALETPRVVASSRPDDVASDEALSRFLERVGEARSVLAEQGVSLGLHNHWWEFEPRGGKVPFDEMLGTMDPDVFFELDLYWAHTAGVAVAPLLTELGARAPLLHVKDGPARHGEPMVAVGSGSLDIEGIVRAGSAEWLIVELDECATDMFDAVDASIEFLRVSGLGTAS